jgi:hypothetical protein
MAFAILNSDPRKARAEPQELEIRARAVGGSLVGPGPCKIASRLCLESELGHIPTTSRGSENTVFRRALAEPRDEPLPGDYPSLLWHKTP